MKSHSSDSTGGIASVCLGPESGLAKLFIDESVLMRPAPGASLSSGALRPE